MANSRQAHLTKAKKGKNDEFYTQWSDIEKEVNAYIELNCTPKVRQKNLTFGVLLL